MSSRESMVFVGLTFTAPRILSSSTNTQRLSPAFFSIHSEIMSSASQLSIGSLCEPDHSNAHSREQEFDRTKPPRLGRTRSNSGKEITSYPLIIS